VRKRIGPDLDLVDLRPILRAAFIVEDRAAAERRPKPAAFPARVRVIDASVDILGEEAERIGHANVDQLAVDDGEQRLRAVRGRDRYVLAEAERVVAIDPDVIGVVGTALRVHALELRPGHPIDGPSFRTDLAVRGLRAVQRTLALAAVEAREVTARERGP